MNDVFKCNYWRDTSKGKTWSRVRHSHQIIHILSGTKIKFVPRHVPVTPQTRWYLMFILSYQEIRVVRLTWEREREDQNKNNLPYSFRSPPLNLLRCKVDHSKRNAALVFQGRKAPQLFNLKLLPKWMLVPHKLIKNFGIDFMSL